MGKDMLDKLGTHPCAFAVESGQVSIDRVVSEANGLCKAGDALVAIKYKKGIEMRILPAYINAYVRYKENAMHSNSLSMEVFLFVAGNMNIGHALKEAGAEGDKFILFSSSTALAEKLIKKCGLKKEKEIKLILDQDVASEVAMTAITDDK